MKLITALDHFQILSSRTDSKRERKIYQKFIAILEDLDGRELTEDQVQSIEAKLDELVLNDKSVVSRRKLNRKLSSFSSFLNDELSLVSEGYYTALGLTFGVAFGVALAPIVERFFGMPVNMGIGMMLGVLIGQYLDSKASKENRVLRTTLG